MIDVCRWSHNQKRNSGSVELPMQRKVWFNMSSEMMRRFLSKSERTRGGICSNTIISSGPVSLYGNDLPVVVIVYGIRCWRPLESEQRVKGAYPGATGFSRGPTWQVLDHTSGRARA
jgi:hypothetical protein